MTLLFLWLLKIASTYLDFKLGKTILVSADGKILTNSLILEDPNNIHNIKTVEFVIIKKKEKGSLIFGLITFSGKIVKVKNNKLVTDDSVDLPENLKKIVSCLFKPNRKDETCRVIEEETKTATEEHQEEAESETKETFSDENLPFSLDFNNDNTVSISVRNTNLCIVSSDNLLRLDSCPELGFGGGPSGWSFFNEPDLTTKNDFTFGTTNRVKFHKILDFLKTRHHSDQTNEANSLPLNSFLIGTKVGEKLASNLQNILGPYLHTQGQMNNPQATPNPTEISSQPLQPGPTGVFSQPLQPGSTGVFSQPLQSGPTGVFSQPLQPGLTGVFSQPLQPGPTEVFSQPLQSEPFSQPSQSGSNEPKETSILEAQTANPFLKQNIGTPHIDDPHLYYHWQQMLMSLLKNNPNLASPDPSENLYKNINKEPPLPLLPTFTAPHTPRENILPSVNPTEGQQNDLLQNQLPMLHKKYDDALNEQLMPNLIFAILKKLSEPLKQLQTLPLQSQAFSPQSQAYSPQPQEFATGNVLNNPNVGSIGQGLQQIGFPKKMMKIF